MTGDQPFSSACAGTTDGVDYTITFGPDDIVTTTQPNTVACRQVDGTQQSFAAPMTRQPDGSVGGFSGWFFGPQGREAGLAFSFRIVDGHDDIVIGGTLAARR